MDWPIYLIIGGAVLIVAAVVLLRRGARGSAWPPPSASYSPSPAREAPSAQARGSVGADVEALARRLLAQGRKIEAIKEVRGATGLGLKDAKEYVEGLEAGPPSQGAGFSAPAPGGRSLTAQEEGELRELVGGGNKIAAIKRLREMTDMGLKEAKDAIEALEAGGSQVQWGAGTPWAAPIRRDLTSREEDELRDLVWRGDKIAAIKRVREITGMGLKEAKDLVDGL